MGRVRRESLGKLGPRRPPVLVPRQRRQPYRPHRRPVRLRPGIDLCQQLRIPCHRVQHERHRSELHAIQGPEREPFSAESERYRQCSLGVGRHDGDVSPVFLHAVQLRREAVCKKDTGPHVARSDDGEFSVTDRMVMVSFLSLTEW